MSRTSNKKRNAIRSKLNEIASKAANKGKKINSQNKGTKPGSGGKSHNPPSTTTKKGEINLPVKKKGGAIVKSNRSTSPYVRGKNKEVRGMQVHSTPAKPKGTKVSTYVRRPKGIADRSPINMGKAQVVPNKKLPNFSAGRVITTAGRAAGILGIGAVVAGTLVDAHLRRQQEKIARADAKLAAAYKSATGRSFANSSVMKTLGKSSATSSADRLSSALSAISSTSSKTSTKKPSLKKTTKPSTIAKPKATKPVTKNTKNKPTSKVNSKAKVAKIIAKDKARADSWAWQGKGTISPTSKPKVNAKPKTTSRSFSAKEDTWDILNF